jgi:hypothetical protein
MKFPHITLFGMFLSLAFAGTDSLRVQLDSLNALDYRTPGVLLTGEFRSGVLNSILDGDGETHTGINAATEADIKLQARPTEDTRVTAFFRIHQDWQKAHEEGVSPVLLDWLSYDGKAWGGRIDFNLGDMRIAYTPLTIYTPLLTLPNEAEIFAARRRDAMAYRHLQDDGGRLLQGLNFEMHSGAAWLFDDLYLQGTLSRLRTQPRKQDVNFFDYDDTDRILFAGRGGFALYGISLGANYVYTFTREEPLKNIDTKVNVDAQLEPNKTPFLMENISVFSATLGVDVARLVGLEGWKINLGGEYAMSKYKTENFYTKKDVIAVNRVDGAFIEVNGELQYIRFSRIDPETPDKTVLSFSKEFLDELDGTAMLASLDVYTPSTLANAGLNLNFIKNDKNFVSELAQNPVYYTPSNVLNAGAVDLIRGATLENLYFATYTNDPLTQYTLTGNSSEMSDEREKLNNNKKAHFLRSGFNNSLMMPAELRSISVAMLDPGINLSLPFGLATPNRQGVLLKIEGSLLDDKLGLNAFANKIDQSETETEKEASYLDAGGGFIVEIGKFIGLSQIIRLNGGYGISRETDGYERSVNRASAGLRVGILPWLSVLGGMELINKDYGSVFKNSVTGNELLWLAGPEFELSRGSYLNLQFGKLNYEFKEGDNTKNLDRTLITADVRVKF